MLIHVRRAIGTGKLVRRGNRQKNIIIVDVIKTK